MLPSDEFISEITKRRRKHIAENINALDKNIEALREMKANRPSYETLSIMNKLQHTYEKEKLELQAEML